MAIRIERRDHRPLKTDARVRAVTDAFARAIRLGYSNAEAAALVNSGQLDIPPKAKAGAVQPQRVEVVRISGRAERAVPATPTPAPVPEAPEAPAIPAQISADDIPPNWGDLPWPNLRELAVSVSGRSIRSRADAETAITEFLGQQET